MFYAIYNKWVCLNYFYEGAIFDVSTQDIQTAFKYEVSSWSVQSKYQSGVKLQEMLLNTHVDDSYSLGTASRLQSNCLNLYH